MCNAQARAERCSGMTKKDLQYRETKTIPIRVLPIIQMTWIASRKRRDWNDNEGSLKPPVLLVEPSSDVRVTTSYEHDLVSEQPRHHARKHAKSPVEGVK
jgi:hypothetical protein